jgi:hypothetical protein
LLLLHRLAMGWGHLRGVHLGDVLFKLGLILGVGELDPFLRSDQQYLFLGEVGRAARELDTLSCRLAAQVKVIWFPKTKRDHRKIKKGPPRRPHESKAAPAMAVTAAETAMFAMAGEPKINDVIAAGSRRFVAPR